MILLPNGKVLVAGGYADNSGPTPPLTSAELYDPQTNTWTNGGDMSDGRTDTTATLLPSGKVLVAGGYHSDHALKSADLYDPATNTWAMGAAKPPDMNGVRAYHTATLLPNGKVLVAGGFDGGSELATVELYDPATNTWATGAAKPPDMGAVRSSNTANLLPNGKVLLVGKTSGAGDELYDPVANAWSSGPSLAADRQQHTATSVCTGRVLVAAGVASMTLIKGAERYSPDLSVPLTGNLLVNGNAEASAAAQSQAGVVEPLGWAVSPNFTAVAYGAPGGFPGTSSGGGGKLFAGGPATPSSSACQTADVSAAASAIDSGTQLATLSADLGGLGAEGDSAEASAIFLGAGGAQLGRFTIGPVKAADRGGQTRLLRRSTGAPVPAGTRSIKVLIATKRTGGSYDNGYADNVSLTVATAPPAIAGMKIKPKKIRPASSGPSVTVGRKKPKTGAKVSYTDTQAGTTTFTVLRLAPGRKVKGKCVKARRENRKKKRCTRMVRVGTFTHVDVAGANGFHFSGRVGGRKLKRGKYRLRAVPRNGDGKVGLGVSRKFRIIR